MQDYKYMSLFVFVDCTYILLMLRLLLSLTIESDHLYSKFSYIFETILREGGGNGEPEYGGIEV